MKKKKELTTEEALKDALRHIYAAHMGINPERLRENDSRRDHRLSQAWNKDVTSPKMIAIMRDNVVEYMEELKHKNIRSESVLDPLCYYVKEYLDREENR